MNVFVVAMLGVLVTMLLALVRAFMGPTVFDRVLAANMFATKTVLLIAVSISGWSLPSTPRRT